MSAIDVIAKTVPYPRGYRDSVRLLGESCDGKKSGAASEKNCSEIEKLFWGEQWGCGSTRTVWLRAQIGPVLKLIQTLKEYFLCPIYCVQLGIPWYQIVIASCTFANMESRYPPLPSGRQLELIWAVGSSSLLNSWHLGSSTAANWVSFDLNVSCSSCWGYSLSSRVIPMIEEICENFKSNLGNFYTVGVMRGVKVLEMVIIEFNKRFGDGTNITKFCFPMPWYTKVTSLFVVM